MSITDYLLNKAINSGFLKSRIQAGARAAALGIAGYLVDHGLATNNESTILVGAVTALVAAYLQDLDVKIVDGKIKIALLTPVPGQTITQTTVVTPEPSPSGQSEEQEEAETRQLNLAQHQGRYTPSAK